MSLREQFSVLPPDLQEEYLSGLDEKLLEEMARGEWWWTQRPNQVPPEGTNHFIFLALAGRGFGKSRAGSEWLVERIQKHPYDTHGVPTEWLVIAETLGDARSVCLEGPAGIIRSLERQKIIYKYLKSPRPMIIFPDGQKIYCEGADDEDVGRGYNASGAWLDEICIAQGEKVQTPQGAVAIEDIQVNDLVMTRVGPRRVLSAGKTAADREVVKIVTTTGSVRVTAEHPVWTEQHGWLPAASLHFGDTMRSWITQIPSQPKPPRTTSGTARPGTTTSAPATTTTALECCYTEQSGQRFTAQSQMGTRSTMSIGYATTTGLPTSNFSPSPTTASSQPTSVMTLPGSKPRLPRPSALGSAPTGSDVSPVMSLATSAALSTNPRVCAPNIARWLAGQNHHVERTLASVISVEPDGLSDVYDLTVEGQPEFFAGSGQLLVHNCKWAKAYDSWTQGIMPSLRAPLFGDHPKVFITTTPKPDKLIIDLVNRTDGTVHLMRGSTFDNANNLSSQVVAELKRQYGNSDLGRQELYGELLLAMDGALFKRTDIESCRVTGAPDDIVATCVGVDPALTDEGDEMGVIVMARTRDDHLYCLADETVRMAGRGAALHCWNVLAAWGADTIVLEENLAKQWMVQVFRDAYFELVGEGIFPEDTNPPLVRIDARIGKRTRGEPVAMRSQQRRLHHVGVFEELEGQLCLFTGWDGKESPDRLDAYVHAARFLMKGEKNKVVIYNPRDYLPKIDLFG